MSAQGQAGTQSSAPSATAVTLERTGDKMPLVGFGCWKVTENVQDTVYNAIKNGYRLIDGAAAYENEVGVGAGIRQAIEEGIVTRKDIFVVTKLWNTEHHKDRVRAACEKSLKEMGLEYIDLYLMHFPIALKHQPNAKTFPGWPASNNKLLTERSSLQDCWREMEKLVDAELVRNIGVSNCNVQTILDMLTYCEYKPATLQIERHPYLQQRELVRWVREQGIHITAYSSFGPASYKDILEKAPDALPLLEHEVIKTIAKKHGRNAGQVLLRWSVQEKVAVIPKSMNPDRMKNNLDIFSWTLDADDVTQINKLERGLRFNDPLLFGFDIPLFD